MKIAFLLHSLCFLTFLFSFSSSVHSQHPASQTTYRLVFWNVENLFDIWDDSTRADEAFTPNGENRWTGKRYKTKLQHISQTLVAIGNDNMATLQMPVLIGMAEVENDKVLRDLCKGTPLRRYHYSYIHYDSPDHRGIDNALLYRSDCFSPFLSKTLTVSDSAAGFLTRDILLVEGLLSNDDTLLVLVNHFPSRRGGATADIRRMEVARTLRYTMDTLALSHPGAAIVVLGDFNASPGESEIRDGLMKGQLTSDDHFVNLMSRIEPGRGTYKYQDQWSCLDQIIVSQNLLDESDAAPHLTTLGGHIFEGDFLLIDDDKYMGRKIFRTYLGMRYQGGYSDHLPVYLDLLSPNGK